ncbi:MAG: hypothetical protein AAGD86_08190 [Pseudomonadota bacterium]
MNQYQMIFGIVFVVMFFSAYRTWIKHRYPRPRKGEPTDNAQVQEQLRMIQQLEERVRVLEKIVTDSNYDLKRQIDELDTGT